MNRTDRSGCGDPDVYVKASIASISKSKADGVVDAAKTDLIAAMRTGDVAVCAEALPFYSIALCRREFLVGFATLTDEAKNVATEVSEVFGGITSYECYATAVYTANVNSLAMRGFVKAVAGITSASSEAVIDTAKDTACAILAGNARVREMAYGAYAAYTRVYEFATPRQKSFADNPTTLAAFVDAVASVFVAPVSIGAVAKMGDIISTLSEISKRLHESRRPSV